MTSNAAVPRGRARSARTVAWNRLLGRRFTQTIPYMHTLISCSSGKRFIGVIKIGCESLPLNWAKKPRLRVTN